LAEQLATAIKEIVEAIDKHNENKNTNYVLRQVASAYYYLPNEPVVLITGEADDVKLTQRYSQDGLECKILSDASVQYPIDKKAIEKIIAVIQENNNSLFPEKSIALSTWTQNPWHPFLLEWEVEFFPTHIKGNLHPDSRSYEQDFITENYTLTEDKVDLFIAEDGGNTTQSANVYSGYSILTPHAGIQLKKKLEDYLQKAELKEENKKLLDTYYQETPIPNEQQSPDYLEQHIDDIKKWYEGKSEEDKNARNPVYTALRAYQKLLKLNYLSQALGGFNAGLLMHKQTMQLSITDPLGFDDYQVFAQQVRDAVQDSIKIAPQPLNDFNPIRAGEMKILRLALVDTFGQKRNFDFSESNYNFVTTELMDSASDYRVVLPPRLTQPARINFRWLSANYGDREMNAHPATTPICGWILPNNLDNSLMIYDNQGQALGSINQNAEWEAAPGSVAAVYSVDAVANEHLRKVVEYIAVKPDGTKEQKQEFLSKFISELDNALENIDPENFAQHESLALLMGRPIAVVRASVNLELQGLPAINQDWNVFRLDMTRDTRETDDFTTVKFPIRIGEYEQLNDGLVGYWLEDEQGCLSEEFYASQSNREQSEVSPKKSNSIVFHSEDQPINIIHQSIDAPPQFLTMLVDPRGKVHATSGILPTKAIDIPPDQYTAALQGIEITFLSAPILTPGKISLPLPDEPGYVWSWLEYAKNTWSEISTIPTIAKSLFVGQFDDEMEANSVWEYLLDEQVGWLQLMPTNSNKAIVISKDRRKMLKLEGNFEGLEEKIEVIFDLNQDKINPVSTEAKFEKSQVTSKAVLPSQQEICEGWLKLSQVK